MKAASVTAKYRTLVIAALAALALPFILPLLGLSLNTGTMVVTLAIATMGLNLCIGYTGLVSFGHSTWFGIGAYAAGLCRVCGSRCPAPAAPAALSLCCSRARGCGRRLGWGLGARGRPRCAAASRGSPVGPARPVVFFFRAVLTIGRIPRKTSLLLV